jgi:hypothetical protein
LTVDGRLEKKKGCVWARYNFVGLAKAFSGWGIAAFGACIRRHELRREVVVHFFCVCISGTVAMKKKTAWFIAQWTNDLIVLWDTCSDILSNWAEQAGHRGGFGAITAA